MTDHSPALDTRWFYALVATGVFLNGTGLFPAILEPDNGLYACIAKRMAVTGDFVNLYVFDQDWLDKPHFPLWMAAISYRIFGVTTFGYKFPALLFFLGSVAYTYHFTRLTYSKLTAQVATLVLLTAFHAILCNNDVRAEPYLTMLIIGPVYHFYRVFLGGRPYHLVLGALLTGCAMMTKGIVVLIPIGAGLVIHWLLTGHWRELLKPRWYAALALSFVFVLPEIYCLYEQFGRHPEKVVYGQTHVSGIKFFFWDSQFGRYFNTGPIKGDGDKFFFVHTLLWAFLPWSLPLYLNVGKAIAGLAKRRNPLPEYVSLGSGLTLFVVFSLSGFQLPHYLNIVFPFYAVLTANFLVSLKTNALRGWTIAQTGIGLLMIGIMVAALFLVQPPQIGLAFAWVGVVVPVTFILFRRATMLSLTGRMVGTMLVVAGVMNLFLYPTFMHYQAGMVAARLVNEQPNSAAQPTLFYGSETFGESSWSYEFYTKGPIQYIHADSTLRQITKQHPARVFTTAVYTDSLARRGFHVRRIALFPYFHISQLTYDFLNHNTRPTTLKPYVLAEVR